MRFTHNNLGHRKKGDIVEVILTSGANVRLMDSINFSGYKHGRCYQYIGGLAKYSPLRLQIPDSGHWHVAIDMQGLKGSAKTSVYVLSDAVPDVQTLQAMDSSYSACIPDNKRIKQSINIGL